MPKLKLILALTQDGASRYLATLKDYAKFFSNQQGSFLGMKNTYQSLDETMDEPSKRGYTKVVTTVPEKLEYFIAHNDEYIKNVLSKERTNGMCASIGELIVGEESWGTFTSNELLAIKSIIEKPEFVNMIQNIPVRTETDIWEPSNLEEYAGRAIFQKPLVTQTNKTTVKEQYILQDPNLDKLKPGADYKPQIASKDKVLELGVQTRQEFSGQWTHVQRAKALEKVIELKKAVTIALEQANNVDAHPSILDGKKLFGFIFS